MAAVAQSAVTITDSYSVGATNGKRRSVVEATLILAAQGGLVNFVAVSLFGLSKATGVKINSCITSGNTDYLVVAQVDQTGTKILFGNYAAGAVTFPSDVATANVKLSVEGYP
jgi:hypothetical protein